MTVTKKYTLDQDEIEKAIVQYVESENTEYFVDTPTINFKRTKGQPLEATLIAEE